MWGDVGGFRGLPRTQWESLGPEYLTSQSQPDVWERPSVPFESTASAIPPLGLSG